MPELSIIVPIYNIGNDLYYSISRILKQTYADFELILVNDGSTDNSGDICEEFKKQDRRVRVIHKGNGGAGSARNEGIKSSKGTYLTFPDADDFCKEDMYQIMMGKMYETNADVVICSYESVNINENGNVIDRRPQNIFNYESTNIVDSRELWFQIRCTNISILNTPWNKIYKREIIESHNIYFPNLSRGQDAVFNMYYYNHVTSVSLINQPLYQYRENDIIKTGRKFPKDVYKCFLELDRVMVETIGGWGMYSGSYKSLCDNHLMGILDECVRLCDNPVWCLSRNEKISYLSELVSNDYLQTKLQSYEGNVDEIEDLIKPTIDKKPLNILRVLRNRKVKYVLRNSIVGMCWRLIKRMLRYM